MTRDQLIIILLIAMAAVLVAELLYILVKKKRRKQEMSMFRKKEAEEEPLGDRAYNAVLTTESICKTLAGQGADTAEAESIISEARRQLARKNYAEAIERAEAAKISLLRAKREMETDTPPLDDGDDMTESQLPPEPKEDVKKDSLPTNFMQARFMIATNKDLLERRGVTSGQAYDLYKEAVRLFDAGDYTQALSCAVKAGKLLESDTVSLIGQETHFGETVEVLVCPSCEKEISDEDVFCRECGQNLAAAPECPGCGNAVETSDKFCRKCGTKLG